MHQYVRDASVEDAVAAGAGMWIRPVQMTSHCFALGLVPLVVAIVAAALTRRGSIVL
jgi:Cu/Ag efflux pump CusA